MIYIGKNRLHYSEIDSTNNELKRLYSKEELDHGTLLTTDYQNGGKGQMGEVWTSVRGKNFLGTFFLKPIIDLNEIFVLNMVTSLAVRETISEFIKSPVEIKWPNDIVVNGKKIGGILIENKLKNEKLTGVFLGIGLNINQKNFPKFKRTATSIIKEIGCKLNIESLVIRLNYNIQQFYSLYQSKGYETINFLYHKELFLKGDEHPYIVGKDTRYLTLQSISRRGDIQLFNQFGEIEEFGLKEIEFLV